MFLMKVTMATFRNFSSYIVKQHSSSSPLLILTSPCIIIKTWSLIFGRARKYLCIHHSHNRDDDGNGGKNNVKGADDDCSSSKTCAAKTFLPPVVRFHHRLLHFQISKLSNNWEFVSQKRETAGRRGWKRLPFFGVWESACACAARESQSASIPFTRHICAKFELRLQTFASVSFHWKWNQHITKGICQIKARQLQN